jgi:hypothetical protein
MAILGRAIDRVPWRCLAIAGVISLLSPAQAQDRPTDYQVKAAFLAKFGKFVEWPDTAFATSNTPVIIGVFGDDPFGDALTSLAETDTINGRPIEVRDIKTPAELAGCHVVFIPASAKNSDREVMDAVAGLPVLTVGETDEFHDAGGMIEFIIENKQVHFRIRNEAARAAGLKISSKLLILARRS